MNEYWVQPPATVTAEPMVNAPVLELPLLMPYAIWSNEADLAQKVTVAASAVENIGEISQLASEPVSEELLKKFAAA